MVVLPFRGTSTGWREGQQESREVQQREVHSPACGEEQLQAPVQAGDQPAGKTALQGRTWGSWGTRG